MAENPRSSTANANSFASSSPSPVVSYFLNSDSRPQPCFVDMSIVHRKYSSISTNPFLFPSIESKSSRKACSSLASIVSIEPVRLRSRPMASLNSTYVSLPSLLASASRKASEASRAMLTVDAVLRSICQRCPLVNPYSGVGGRTYTAGGIRLQREPTARAAGSAGAQQQLC